MIAQALAYRLMHCTPVTDIVTTRVYPNVAQQGATMPFIVYQLISDVPAYSHQGEYGPRKARFQVTCFDTTYANAKIIRDGVRNVLSGWVDLGASNGASGTYAVFATFFENEGDIPQDYGSGAETPVFGSRIDVLIQYRETNKPTLPAST